MTTHFRQSQNPRLPDNYAEHLERHLPEPKPAPRWLQIAVPVVMGLLAGAVFAYYF